MRPAVENAPSSVACRPCLRQFNGTENAPTADAVGLRKWGVLMDIRALLRFLSVAERLKCNTRHAFTSSGRPESVAEHCWRLALFAWLVRDAFPDTDIDRVVLMCLVHDLGEAVTGDIPTFLKTERDEQTESAAVGTLLDTLPQDTAAELRALFDEIAAGQTAEAKLFCALDKLEAVLQHNEGDISTWLPLEYDLQLTHGAEETAFSPYLTALKTALNEQTLRKIAADRKDASKTAPETSGL